MRIVRFSEEEASFVRGKCEPDGTPQARDILKKLHYSKNFGVGIRKPRPDDQRKCRRCGHYKSDHTVRFPRDCKKCKCVAFTLGGALY